MGWKSSPRSIGVEFSDSTRSSLPERSNTAIRPVFDVTR